MSIFPLLLSAITCTPNADGTWTCSGDTIDDLPSIVEQDGNYVCTNCVAISSNECERIRHEVQTNCQAIATACLNAWGSANNLAKDIDSLISQFSSFEPCPYNTTASKSGLTSEYGLPSSSANSVISIHQRDVVLPQWQATANWAFVQIDPVYKYSTSLSSFYIFHNDLCGIWTCSYAIATNMVNELNAIRQYPNQIIDYSNEAQSTSDYIFLRSQEVTCAQCTLGSSSAGGDGGGSGSETGCLECYLAQLRQINSNLDTIKGYLSQIKNDLSQFKIDFNREIQKVLDSLDDLNDTAWRIDDYLSIDQSNRLFRIHVTLDSVTNLISRYHRSFALASDSKVDDDMRQVFTDQGFDWNAYNEKTNWFNRVEILLAHIAGVDSNLVSSVEEDATLSNNVGIVDYDTALGVYENDSSQNTANQDAKDVIDSFSDVVDAFNFFGSVHEPQEIWFIEGGAIDIGDSSSSMAVNIKMSDESYFRDFLRCIRWGCVVLWYLLGFGLLYFVFISLYDKIMKLIRFCLSLSASVFGS